jgi:hypothetical protein
VTRGPESPDRSPLKGTVVVELVLVLELVDDVEVEVDRGCARRMLRFAAAWSAPLPLHAARPNTVTAIAIDPRRRLTALN